LNNGEKPFFRNLNTYIATVYGFLTRLQAASSYYAALNLLLQHQRFWAYPYSATRHWHSTWSIGESLFGSLLFRLKLKTASGRALGHPPIV